MKAIEINGEIKTFGSVPKRWSDDNGTHFNIGDGAFLGFKDVVNPEIDSRIEEFGSLRLDGNSYIYNVLAKTFTETLAELKEQKVSQLKSMVGGKLYATDWYIIRESDNGEATPQSIKTARAKLRALSNAIEADINALTTKKAVVLFDINL